jgi:hypothetical protein
VVRLRATSQPMGGSGSPVVGFTLSAFPKPARGAIDFGGPLSAFPSCRDRVPLFDKVQTVFMTAGTPRSGIIPNLRPPDSWWSVGPHRLNWSGAWPHMCTVGAHTMKYWMGVKSGSELPGRVVISGSPGRAAESDLSVNLNDAE